MSFRINHYFYRKINAGVQEVKTRTSEMKAFLQLKNKATC